MMRLVVGLWLVVMAGQAAAEDCSRRNAERATVYQIVTNPGKYMSRCVVVEGTMRGSMLYESVDGVYLQSREIGNPSSSGFRLGLSGRKLDFSGRYRPVSIVGIALDCETTRDLVDASAKEGEIVMVMGYCHTANGSYLLMKDLDFTRAPSFQRRMGSFDRPNYGDLIPAPADWPHRKLIDSLADQFLAALRTRDAETLLDIHFRNVGLEWPDDETKLLRFLLKDRRSPFAPLRNNTTAPQRIILVEKPLAPVSGAHEYENVDDYSATVCFCRVGNCSELWPIASFDADNLASRPYACTKIGPYHVRRETRTHFATPIEEHGLEEPAGE